MIVYFSEFLDFKKYFYKSNGNPNNFFCIHEHLHLNPYSIGPHVDAVSPALSGQSVLRWNPPDQHVPRAIKGGSY